MEADDGEQVEAEGEEEEERREERREKSQPTMIRTKQSRTTSKRLRNKRGFRI